MQGLIGQQRQSSNRENATRAAKQGRSADLVSWLPSGIIWRLPRSSCRFQAR